MRPSLFVGAYTAVTKALWHKRLNKRGTPPVGAALPPIVEKPPELTSVEYPFTTNREFLEMVRHPGERVKESCTERPLAQHEYFYLDDSGRLT